MTLVKKLLFTAIFVAVIILVPGLILLLTVDATQDFSVYVVVYGIILFAIFGYIIVSIHSISKEIHDALEEMKMQNAAIAYKLTNSEDKAVAEDNKVTSEKTVQPVVETPKQKTNLNPADPLTIDGKVVSDNFGDFK